MSNTLLLGVVLPAAFSLFVAVAAASGVWTLLGVPVPPVPRLGHRGAARRAALDAYSLFCLVDPLLRFCAGVAAFLPGERLRRRCELALKRADYPAGLTPDETMALAVLSSLSLGLVAWVIARATDTGAGIVVPALVFGSLLPTLQVEEIIRQRVKAITRGLPHAIEIAALCMSAGADFPGALRLLVGSARERTDSPLKRELSYILEELDLGHTRREALLAFGERVQTPAVRDFVSAVVQAEEKGNPLAKVIQIQGRVLNQRRSVAAEEAAARAGVMMMAPLVLLLGAVILVLLGPIIVRVRAGGM